MKSAKGSNSARFAHGGGVKRPHLGRMGRANGGKIPIAVNNETDTTGKKTPDGVVGKVEGGIRTDAGPIRQGDTRNISATSGSRRPPGSARRGRAAARPARARRW